MRGCSALSRVTFLTAPLAPTSGADGRWAGTRAADEMVDAAAQRHDSAYW